MLEDGLSYPLQGDSALGRIVVGAVLIFFSWLIIPLFLLFGYLVRVLGETAKENPEPPAFDEWGKMLVDGMKAFVVTLAYGIIPFALLAFSLGIGGAGGASGSDTAAGILGGIGLLGILVSILSMLILYYLVPAALTNMVVEDSVAAAFDLARLKDVLLSVEYLVAWVIPFLIGFIANVVTGFIVVITFGIGALVVPFVQFYVQVSIFYMFGRAFGNVTDSTTATQTPATDVV